MKPPVYWPHLFLNYQWWCTFYSLKAVRLTPCKPSFKSWFSDQFAIIPQYLYAVNYSLSVQCIVFPFFHIWILFLNLVSPLTSSKNAILHIDMVKLTRIWLKKHNLWWKKRIQWISSGFDTLYGLRTLVLLRQRWIFHRFDESELQFISCITSA